jgi:AsmA protein
LKWILIAAGALVLLLAGVLVALPWLVDVPRVQAYVANAASQALGRPVRFTSLTVSAFPTPSVRIKGLQVAEDPRFGNQPFLVVEEGRFRLRLRPLLSGRVELTDLTLDKVRVEIIDDGGRLNVASLGPTGAGGRGAARPSAGVAPAAGAAAAISQIRLKDGVAHFVRRGAQGLDLRLEDMDLVVRPSGETYTLEGSARLEPGGLRFKLAQTALTVPLGRALGESPLRATVDVSGADVAGLIRGFVASPAVRGPVEGRLRVAGTVSQPTAQGDFTFSGLTLSDRPPQCSPPPERQLQLGDVRVPVAFAPARLDAAPLTARVAGGAVSARLSIALAPTARIVTVKDLDVKGVALGPVLVDYLCQAYAVTGPLELAGNAAFADREPLRTLNGAGRLRIGRGRVVGEAALGLLRDIVTVAGLVAPLVEGKPIAVPSRPLDFESITATYRISNGVVASDDLLYQGEGLTGNVAGTYGLADGRVNMAVTLTQGRTQVKAHVSGVAGQSLRVTPTGITQGGQDAVRQLLERLLR